MAADQSDGLPKTPPKLEENDNITASSARPGRPRPPLSLEELHNTMAAFNPSEPSTSSPTSPPPTPGSTPPILRPFNADHYIPNLPFSLSPSEVGPASPHWLLAMQLCGYPDQSTTNGHYFTKSVTYYPSWKTRIIRKNEHRLVPEAKKIETRERWALQLYYGGPRRDGWDEVCPAEWDGAELDVACELEEQWIEEILWTIKQALSEEISGNAGTEVMLRTDEQAQNVQVGGDGGTFALCMLVLAKAVERHEAVLRGIDPGGPRSWETERDAQALIEKYAR